MKAVSNLHREPGTSMYRYLMTYHAPDKTVFLWMDVRSVGMEHDSRRYRTLMNMLHNILCPQVMNSLVKQSVSEINYRVNTYISADCDTVKRGQCNNA